VNLYQLGYQLIGFWLNGFNATFFHNPWQYLIDSLKSEIDLPSFLRKHLSM